MTKIILLITFIIAIIVGYSWFNKSQSNSKLLDNQNAYAKTQKELQAKKDGFKKNAPSSTKEIYTKGIEQVAKSGVLENALNVGDTAPNFTLPTIHGTDLELYKVLETSPVIVTWYRGGWCPYCNIYLRGLERFMPKLKPYNAQIIAISPETVDKTIETTVDNDIAFAVLSDKGNKVADDYNISYTLPAEVAKAFVGRIDIPAYNGDDSFKLPLAATYVIGKDRKIHYAFIDADYRERASFDVILESLEKLR